MPNMKELLERIGQAKFVSTLDLTKGYRQIPLAPEDKVKMAFRISWGLCQFTRMPFGLHRAPASFQWLMNKILLAHQEYATEYIDDIVIFFRDMGTTYPPCKTDIGRTKTKCTNSQSKKCTLGQTETKYLGFKVGCGKISSFADKVEAFQCYWQPQTKKQLQGFLGLENYFWKFIPWFSELMAPLTGLLQGREGRQVEWMPETQAAFMKIKPALCHAPVLYTPNFKQTFWLHVDTLAIALGAVLTQWVEGEEWPIAFVSRKLSRAETQYSTVERECLAIK